MVARLMEEGTNIMEMVTKSDIAWSILVLLNNEKYWDYLGGKRTSVAPAIEEGPSEEPSEDGDESEEEEVDPTLPELRPHPESRKARTQLSEDGDPPNLLQGGPERPRREGLERHLLRGGPERPRRQGLERHRQGGIRV